ncbi:MAG: hypothetical protein HY300_03050, partial [Verrucomicrobia bacterium]|nr:hypothetical protein [Verrucomicrobiota bacterium]
MKRNHAALLFCFALFGAFLSSAFGQSVYTTPYTFGPVAGSAQNGGSAEGTNSDARFYYPVAVTLDRAGNIYVADTYNDTIRKLTPSGTNWVVSTIAGLAGTPGSNDDTNTAARFYHPYGVAADRTPVGTNWVVTTIAGLAGNPGSNNDTNTAARFNAPNGIAVDNAGAIYVADFLNHAIRKVTPVGTNWVVSTLAGSVGNPGSADGTNTAAQFNGPIGIAVDAAGAVFVADYFNHTIRKLTPVGTNWVVTTPVGSPGNSGNADDTNNAARFNFPRSVAADSAGNIFVADSSSDTIRKMTPVGTNWIVSTVAGLTGVTGGTDDTGSA